MRSPHSQRVNAWSPSQGCPATERRVDVLLPTAAQSRGQLPPGHGELYGPGAQSLVGREREMAVLHVALTQAMAGRGQLVLIAGEPGIGKTRLLEECALLAHQRQAGVLWGWCWEGDGAPAFWPWVQMLRRALHPRLLATDSPELASSAAALAQFLPDIWEHAPHPPSPSLGAFDPEIARFRFFDCVTTFLKRLAQQQPLVLLLDDLHWADISSLRLLCFLAHELRDARLCVLGTYRDVDVSRSQPLSEILGDLPRESHHLLLQGLTVVEVTRLLAQVSGCEPDMHLGSAVHAQTDGNPF